MNKLRSVRMVRIFSLFMVINIFTGVFAPTVSMALTSGPTQPEVQSFQPANTTEMVNAFTGDFSYNIPLFELPGPDGGYPFNLSYSSGISMDQEASWVGLGWNLNPGAITRDARGIPDDFNGDMIKKEADMKQNVTFGFSTSGNAGKKFTDSELWGLELQRGLGLGITFFYNNYNGPGYSVDPSISMGLAPKDSKETTSTFGPFGGLGMSINSQEGIGMDATLGMGLFMEQSQCKSSVGIGYNSKAGLKDLALNFDIEKYAKIEKDQVVALKGFHESFFGTIIPDYGMVDRTVVTKWAKTLNVIGASVSFSSPSYVPNTTTPTIGYNVSVGYAQGVDNGGKSNSIALNGFFNIQKVKDKVVNAPSYGYLYMQNDANRDDIVDFNRSQDGVILKNTPYLPAPALMQDSYIANAQGLSATYRPSRSDISAVYDKTNLSESYGGTTSGEYSVGGGFVHMGLDLSINYSKNLTTAWEDGNLWKSMNGNTSANPFAPSDLNYEPVIFKTYGETTSEPTARLGAVGDFEPYRIELADHTANMVLVNNAGNKKGQAELTKFYSPTTPTTSGNVNNGRKTRQASIVAMKNKDIHFVSETLPEFAIQTFTIGTADADYKTGAQSFTRPTSGNKYNHIAGFVSTSPTGTKYVYGIPAYNSKQVECMFSSVKGISEKGPVVSMPVANNLPDYKGDDTKQTQQMFSRVTTPDFAHSYLLTAVLGADYIDIDNIPGPSEGDLGYWVKFSYTKSPSTYKWRTPFNGTNYNKGAETTIMDDNATYMYGEKEVWHLAKAETKSHVAVFIISDTRPDAYGVSSEYQNAGDALGSKSYQLDKITLYNRAEYNKSAAAREAVVSVDFVYTNDLCKGAPNNSQAKAGLTTKTGKLVLKSLAFNYGKSTRGSLSKYEFDYHASVPEENPDYLPQGYDRWGTYRYYDKDANADELKKSLDHPYTPQFDNVAGAAAFKTKMDQWAAVWTLKSIKMPSGAKIDITYEADDYAYVQNKEAMQMMKIVALQDNNGNYTPNANVVSHTNTRVYFELENPVNATLSQADIQKEIKKYIPKNKQLYFKIYSRIGKPTSNVDDYVSGYADLEEPDINTCGFAETAPPYKTGYVTVKKTNFKDNLPDKYHPFAFAAWVHVRTETPYVMNIAGMKADPNTSTGSKTQKIKNLQSVVGEMITIFQGFYPHCNSKDMGERIDLRYSYIRLNSPDKKKIGGGSRVKEISLSDNWSDMTGGVESTSYYGQTYDYTTEENGQIISSGVALNEPYIGGDESALKSMTNYYQKVPLKTPNRLMTEFPINEAYYPGPSVGYSKVTVKSLVSTYNGKPNNYNIPATFSGAGNTGATCYEFYTAKDYPVIEDQTNVWTHPLYIPVFVPFVGQVTVNQLTMSQGYYVELNDMHGKLKMETAYELDALGNIVYKPLKYTKYNYKSDAVYTDGTKVNASSQNVAGNNSGEVDYYRLNNKVQTLIYDDGTVSQEERYVGQEVEMFTDMRETKAKSFMGGLSFNIEWLQSTMASSFLLMPQMNIATNRVRTAVTNKIIHKVGILESIEMFEDNSKKTMVNTLFDPISGQPVASKIINDFNDPVYSYELPSHLVKDYELIGPKSMNERVAMKAVYTGTDNYTSPTGVNTQMLYFSSSAPGVNGQKLLSVGDKIFITKYDPANPNNVLSRSIGLVKEYTYTSSVAATVKIVYVSGNISGLNYSDTYTLEVYDPVRNNNLGANAFAVSALSDPLLNRIQNSCIQNVSYPVPTYATCYIPTECSYNAINTINTYIKSPEFAMNMTATIDGSKYCIKNPNPYNKICKYGTGEFHFMDATTSSCTAFNSTIVQAGMNDLVFYYDDGTLVDFSSVNQLSALTATNPTYPVIPSLSYNNTPTSTDRTKLFYSMTKVTVQKTNGQTQTAYVFYHTYKLSTTAGDLQYSMALVRTQGISCLQSVAIVQEPVTATTYAMNKILTTSASVLTNAKPLDKNELNHSNRTISIMDVAYAMNPYANNTLGKFLQKESWTYLDDRSQTAGTMVNIRQDGTFSNMPFFKHNSPLVKGCPGRWTKATTVTDFDPAGVSQEEMDALNIKGAALFGYNGNVATAIAGNATTAEIGFDGFEDYPSNALSANYIGSSNLNFYLQSMQKTQNVYENQNILVGNYNVIVIDKPYNANIEYASVEIDGNVLVTGAKVNGNYQVINAIPYPGDATKTIVNVGNSLTYNETFPATLNNVRWQGTCKLLLSISSRKLDVSGTPAVDYAVISPTAHTGKYALLVKAATSFEQRRIVLTPTKKMVVEAWTARGARNGQGKLWLTFLDKNGAIVKDGNGNILGYAFGETGNTIEKWRKVYGEFVVPANAVTPVIGFSVITYTSAGTETPSTYFDDIRMYPAASNMKSFVYNPATLRLSATLDANNYATFYYYDPSGQLYLTKAETEKGIMTTQEVQSQVKH